MANLTNVQLQTIQRFIAITKEKIQAVNKKTEFTFL